MFNCDGIAPILKVGSSNRYHDNLFDSSIQRLFLPGKHENGVLNLTSDNRFI